MNTIISTPSSLPIEICAIIATHLANCDIKNLRLTSKNSLSKFRLRLNRVFLSANPLNIQVFRSIAEHETFRNGVIEIIWDDAQLVGNMSSEEEERLDSDLGFPEGISDGGDEADQAPRWYSLACRENMSIELRRGCFQQERLAHRARMQQAEAQLPANESWAYYRRLLRQQQEVLLSGDDADALRYGLSRFPALRRVTVTPAAHGFLFAPLYETPMIRAFPAGFNYPIPRGWPTPTVGLIPYELKSWDDEEERRQWRGVSIVLRELAEREHHVVEFLLNTNNINTALSCRMFENPCQEYTDFKALFSRPGFRYLDLSLLADSEDWNDWKSFGNGRLYNALGQTTVLEHIDFRMQIDCEQDLILEHLPPLRTMLPLDRWPKLRHFGLTNVIVAHDDLLSVLQSLPKTICSVELSKLRFVDEGINHGYQGLLRRLREDLDWRTRLPSERPRIIIHIDAQESSLYRYLCLDKEATSYIYGDGENPFGQPGQRNVMWPPPFGVGVVRDPFEPDFEAPE